MGCLIEFLTVKKKLFWVVMGGVFFKILTTLVSDEEVFAIVACGIFWIIASLGLLKEEKY